MNISEVLKKDRIILGLDAKDKADALNQMTEILYKSGALADQKAFLDDVTAREAVSTTGIGNGIAIPHGKSANVNETTVAVARLKNEVEWESVDDLPVKFVVLLAVNEANKTGVHVRLLSQMARKLASEETCKRLLNAETADEVINIFSE